MANDKRNSTLAYFLARPGEYADGITIEDIMSNAKVSKPTAYAHITWLMSNGLVKKCGIDGRAPGRVTYYLDQVAYKNYSPDPDKILLPGTTNNTEIMAKLDTILVIVSNGAARPANNYSEVVTGLGNMLLERAPDITAKRILELLVDPHNVSEWERVNA